LGLFSAEDLENLRKYFPNLDPKNDKVTSPKTQRGNPVVYNCVAHASHDETQWWEYPSPEIGFTTFWPSYLNEGDSVESWVELFRREGGYEGPTDDSFEKGYEKIAIYANNKKATHVARQVGKNRWRSKLGFGHDIEHARLDSLNGWGEDDYGKVEVILKRKKIYGKRAQNRD
jgi:hypothetical protein